MTVRQRIDHLATEPPLGDLGYAADQRLVAGALLGLQLLADEIDALKAGRAGAADTVVVDDRDIADDVHIADIVDRLADLTAQVKKLTKAVKQGTGTRGTDKPVTGKQKKQKSKSKKLEKSEKSDDSPGLE